jgi:hypothetical protein
MKIIHPFDLAVESIDSLLYDKQIIEVDADNRTWIANIFPDTTELNIPAGFNSSSVINTIDSKLFSDYTIVGKYNSIIETDVRKIVKCEEFGDHNDSIKRWVALNTPIGYDKDYTVFTNKDIKIIPKTVQREYTSETVFGVNTKQNEKIAYTSNKKFYNDKTTLMQILKWGKEKGINYIYCIKEYKINAISNKYVLPYIYYTIIGSK